MRLSKNQIHEINAAIGSFLQTCSYSIYLFGNRAENKSNDGVLELLLIVDSEDTKNSFLKIKPVLINELKKQSYISKSGINLVIGTKEDLTKDPFISKLNNKLLLLSKS